MRRLLEPFVLAFTLIACGGTPPAESPDSVEVPPESGAAAASSGAADGAGEAGTEPPSSGPASTDDINAILQLVINDEEVDKSLNLSQPGRFPLKVSGDAVPKDLKIEKSTEPVQVVEAPQSKKDAVLVFTEIEVSGNKASVRFQYDVEGVRGTANLTKGPHGWEVTSSRVVER